MQKSLDKANSYTVEKMVTEIEERFPDILVDQYGNYFCQELFKKLNDNQKLRLLNTLKESSDPVRNTRTHFLDVAQDQRGTHSLQGFLNCLNKPMFNEILTQIFVQNLLDFAYNKHATHVLITYIELVDISPYLEPIYDIICRNMIELSQDANGLPVIKKTVKKFYVS